MMFRNCKYICTIAIVISVIHILFSGCCSWSYDTIDMEFTETELRLMGPYEVGDTIYFTSNLGDMDTIVVLDTFVDKQRGNRCWIRTGPYNYKAIVIKHLPNDNWAGTSQSQGEPIKITYQHLVGIGKSPMDSTGRVAGYSVSYRDFTTSQNALAGPCTDVVINGRLIPECFKISRVQAEGMINPESIDLVYWTAVYGLTAYTNRAGETWLINDGI